MEWAEVIAIIAVNIGVFSWLRSDMKSFESKIENEVRRIGVIMHKESKDFHGRLCQMEERNKRRKKQKAEQ